MAIPFINTKVKPSVNELRLDLAYFFPEITHFYGGGNQPDHVYGRCLDAMVYDSSKNYVEQQGRNNLGYADRVALGGRILAFLRENAKHYGLNGVIWNRKVYGFPHDDAPFGKNWYRGPYNVARNYTRSAHDDHLHIDQDGSEFAPLRDVGAPMPLGTVWVDLLVPGVTNSISIRLTQRALGVEQTGTWDAATIAAAKAYQASLGDDVDGYLGPKQVTRLFADKKMTVTVRLDPSGQAPKPATPDKKPEPPVVSDPDPITLRLKDWKGSPAGRTLIQGVLWDEANDCYFIHQADTVAGQAEQNVVIRRHKADGTYVGWATIVGAGHGSSVGLDPFDGGARLWLGHATLGSSGFMAYNIGDADTPFTKTPAIPKGDISIDQANDLLCVRVGTRFRGYKLSDARNNKATKTFDFKVPNWLTRFQGHLVTGGRLYVHRDAKTKGASELRSFDFTGKLLRKWDTSPWGDEAEGAMAKRGWVYSVSRVGNDTPGRTILCTPIEEI